MKKITVKEESIIEFFTSNATRTEDQRAFNSFVSESGGFKQIELHYLFKNEILIKRGFVPEGAKVLFTLSDVAEQSRTKLTNHYTYKAESYDDVSVKLVLVDFNITLDKIKKPGEF